MSHSGTAKRVIVLIGQALPQCRILLLFIDAHYDKQQSEIE